MNEAIVIAIVVISIYELAFKKKMRKEHRKFVIDIIKNILKMYKNRKKK